MAEILAMLLGLWLKGAFWSLFGIILTEIAPLLLRLDYPHPDTSDNRELPPIPYMMLFWLCAWPVFATLWVIGMFQGRTLTQQLDHIMKKMDDSTQEMKKKAAQIRKVAEQDATAIIRDTPSFWQESLTLPIGSTQALLRKLPAELLMSHFIILHPNQTISCLRVATVATDSFVWKTVTSEAEAKALCEADLEWALLCVKGMEPKLEEARLKWLKEHP